MLYVFLCIFGRFAIQGQRAAWDGIRAISREISNRSTSLYSWLKMQH